MTKDSNLRVSPAVHKWLDDKRNGIPKVKFLTTIIEQLDVKYTSDGKPTPVVKKAGK